MVLWLFRVGWVFWGFGGILGILVVDVWGFAVGAVSGWGSPSGPAPPRALSRLAREGVCWWLMEVLVGGMWVER